MQKLNQIDKCTRLITIVCIKLTHCMEDLHFHLSILYYLCYHTLVCLNKKCINIRPKYSKTLNLRSRIISAQPVEPFSLASYCESMMYFSWVPVQGWLGNFKSFWFNDFEVPEKTKVYGKKKLTSSKSWLNYKNKSSPGLN